MLMIIRNIINALPKVGLFFAIVTLIGCSSITRLPAPADPCKLSEIPGIPEVRFWGDDSPPNNIERAATIRKQITSDPAYDRDESIHFLAISGGGQNGAFGAGLLTGWSQAGTRPEFRMVTGISTGSLIAPFAFLGSDYDEAIRDMYTLFSTKDVINKRFVSGIFSADSLSDNAPLRTILKSYFTEAEMALVAKEHARGRRLFVGTTYLDVQRPVIWDIGAIASSAHPDAYALIIDVLLASTAIPGAFPPVYFKAEQDGVVHDELHVDGGVTAQVFISPVSFRMEDALKQAGLHGQAHIYILHNSQIAPDIMHVKPKTMPILSHSLATLLRAQGMGDMFRIYQNAQINGFEYYAASIPDDFREEPEEPFDIDYMTDLFKLAFEQAKIGYEWNRKPPEFQHQSSRGPE